MKALTAISAAIFFTFSAQAADLYTENGDVIEVPEGSKVYISDAPVYKFTRFDESGFDLRPVQPIVAVEEVCVEGGFTFGGTSEVCTEEVIVEEPEDEVEECGAFTFGGGC
jgi:hypothetical protein